MQRPIRDVHLQRNQSSQSAWELFAEHRSHVTDIMTSAGGGRLSVWGAGNCNDLDLSKLVTCFSEIHLIDIDKDAIQRGLKRQGLESADGIFVHQIDVSGSFDVLESWSNVTPGDEISRGLVNFASACLPQELREFDVSVSLCLLTQLIDSIKLAVGDNHPQFVSIMQTIRLRHLQLLLESVRPGQPAYLISDLISSETFPSLRDIPQAQLNAALAEQVECRNFFTGTNPGRLVEVFQQDSVLRQLTRDVRVSEPWRWNLGPRVYGVYALEMTRVD